MGLNYIKNYLLSDDQITRYTSDCNGNPMPTDTPAEEDAKTNAINKQIKADATEQIITISTMCPFGKNLDCI